MTSTRHRRTATLLALLLVCVAGAALLLRYGIYASDRIPRDAIVVPRDAATFDAALRRVEPGGTIALGTGDEPIAGPVVIDVPGITIRSLGSRAHFVARGTAPTISVQADDVTLRDLTVSGEGVGVFVSSAGCRVMGVTVRETAVAVRLVGARNGLLDRIDVEGGRIAFDLASSSGCQVRRSTARDVAEAGVRIAGSWECALRRLTIENAPVGVLVEDASRGIEVADCRIDECGASAVLVRNSNAVSLFGNVLRSARVGVTLSRTTGCEVRACAIDRAAEAGVLLEESVQNSVRDTTLEDCGKTGITLSRSATNALSGNAIRGAADTGILLTSSDRTLVERNEIRGALAGLRLDGASSCRILRNIVAARDLGLVLQAGEDHHVLDNRVAGTVFGIVGISTTGNMVLRNRIESPGGSALALLGGSTRNCVSRNTASRSGVGILVAASPESDVLDNSVTWNDIGVLLLRTGPGLRVEGNRLTRNAIGLRQAASVSDLLPQLARLREYLPLSSDGEISTPVLANNLFHGSRELDVQNDAGATLYAGENHWGPSKDGDDASGARVSPNVSLKESAWKGTIAIGADGSDLQAIVGNVLRAVIARAGYRTVDLIGIGSPDLVRSAVRAGDADLIYVEPKTDGSADFGTGVTTLLLPARAEWVAVVPQQVADGLAEPSLSALSAAAARGGSSLLWVVPEAFDAAGVAALQSAYDLTRHVRAVVRAKTLAEAESLLTVGAAQLALLPNLEETVTPSGFTRLEDDRHVLPSQDMAVLVHDDLLRAHPDIRNVLARVLPLLTPTALRDLLTRVRLSHRSPESVATEFLVIQGLLSE